MLTTTAKYHFTTTAHENEDQGSDDNNRIQTIGGNPSGSNSHDGEEDQIGSSVCQCVRE